MAVKDETVTLWVVFGPNIIWNFVSALILTAAAITCVIGEMDATSCDADRLCFLDIPLYFLLCCIVKYFGLLATSSIIFDIIGKAWLVMCVLIVALFDGALSVIGGHFTVGMSPQCLGSSMGKMTATVALIITMGFGIDCVAAVATLCSKSRRIYAPRWRGMAQNARAAMMNERNADDDENIILEESTNALTSDVVNQTQETTITTTITGSLVINK